MNDEQLALASVLETARARVALGKKVPHFGEEDHDVAVVATALLRKALIQATAALTIVQTEVAEAAIPNVRSLFEAFGELHCLLQAPDELSKARTAFLYALRQLRDYSFKWNDDPNGLARVNAQLEEIGRAVPDAYAEALARQNYWTKIGRAQLIENALVAATAAAGLGADLGNRLYKLLSWDEHHVMATLLVIGLDPSAPDFGTVKKQEAPDDPHEFLPFLAAAGLAGMLKLYDERFP